MSWAAKYRPRTFEEVHGQARAVETLGKLVADPNPCCVVLHGHTGAGKSTLARIYAQARLCEAPQPSGSPCLACPTCVLIDQGRQREFRFYSPAMQNAEELQRIVNEIQPHSPITAKQRVFIFDEAAKLGTRLETLYGELEKPSHGTTFIFTLLDLAALPEPARDRLIKVELLPADPAANVENLERICEREHLAHEPEALRLLAEASGSFRRSVENLEAVALQGPVTAAAVYEHVVAARVRWLVDYFEALAVGDLAGQLQAFAEARLSPEEQLSALQNVLAELKLKDIGPARFSTRRQLSLVSATDRRRILSFVEALARETGQDLPFLWDGVMQFWSSPPEPLSAEALRLHVLRFNSLVHGEAPASAARPARSAVAIEAMDGPWAQRALRPSRRRRKGDPCADRGAYLDLSQTEKLYEAASFALQRYWAPFNCIIEMTWDAAPSASPTPIGDRLAEFLRRLSMRLDEWGVAETQGFARLLMKEKLQGGEFVTVLVGHVPVRHFTRLDTWIEDQKQSGIWGARIEPELRTSATWTHQLERHWDLMRRLWRGVDPSILVDERRALIDVLEVPPRTRRPAGLIPPKRVSISAPLSAPARRAAANDGFPLVSAFAERRWGALFSGWEREAYEYQLEELKARQRDAHLFGGELAASEPLQRAAQTRAARKRLSARADLAVGSNAQSAASSAVGAAQELGSDAAPDGERDAAA